MIKTEIVRKKEKEERKENVAKIQKEKRIVNENMQ